MGLYLCRWQNGDFSVVQASNKEHAIEMLDEVANAEGFPIYATSDFMVHFRLTDGGEIELEDFGEEFGDRIMERIYPALGKLDFPPPGTTPEEKIQVKEAVELERHRVMLRPNTVPQIHGDHGDKRRTLSTTWFFFSGLGTGLNRTACLRSTERSPSDRSFALDLMPAGDIAPGRLVHPQKLNLPDLTPAKIRPAILPSATSKVETGTGIPKRTGMPARLCFGKATCIYRSGWTIARPSSATRCA